MEWFYRFLKEPKRMFKRYFIDDMRFFWYFGKQLLGLYKVRSNMQKKNKDHRIEMPLAVAEQR